jgi:hypothetical protein
MGATAQGGKWEYGGSNVSEQQIRDTLERYFETFERQDPGAFVELLHVVVVEEFP